MFGYTRFIIFESTKYKMVRGKNNFIEEHFFLLLLSFLALGDTLCSTLFVESCFRSARKKHGLNFRYVRRVACQITTQTCRRAIHIDKLYVIPLFWR